MAALRAASSGRGSDDDFWRLKNLLLLLLIVTVAPGLREGAAGGEGAGGVICFCSVSGEEGK